MFKRVIGLQFLMKYNSASFFGISFITPHLKEILRCWKYRRLALRGKVTVIKSLVVSQLVYLLSPLCSNYKVLVEINDLLYTFLWNGKGDKIKRRVIINDLGAGGLKMIDISSFK